MAASAPDAAIFHAPYRISSHKKCFKTVLLEICGHMTQTDSANWAKPTLLDLRSSQPTPVTKPILFGLIVDLYVVLGFWGPLGQKN